ncbi:DUF2877 domain-containing protein [Cryptosporangium arvum]|uniref:DUF2877 domain-containing protein n=1 Tax=Cryptosporangium arvum DSM 44712 TaxID=927661 RepID=A0A011ABM2_9ACTN|nr:DUF2877 domain-containing protein [Cryptosporangium arvum]EXG79421.1 Protein of unknown function (DUF2877) [Cryptosporangium arvum DSM 44712]
MTLPGAASMALAPVLSGPTRSVTVTAALPRALYLATGDPHVPALCVIAADAVRVPCAIRLGPGVPVPTAVVGSTAYVGDGRLAVGDRAVAVTRWWRPSRPRVQLSDLHARQRALRTDADVSALSGTSVRELLGRGEGLTPYGDDILSGALVTLIAGGHHAGQVIASMVAHELATRPGATTAVSAALLTHAMRGECIPELAAVLTDPLERLDSAVEALLRVGHSSGGGLLQGVRTGLEVLTGPAPTVRMVK